MATLPGRRDQCEKCKTDFRCCHNCVHFDRAVAHQCRERRAEPVQEKDRANYCEYFDFARRVFIVSNNEANTKEEAARNELKKLFGD